jgi:hypothetical protein
MDLRVSRSVARGICARATRTATATTLIYANLENALTRVAHVMRGFAARRANMDVILEKNHIPDAAARAAPKINNR